MYANEHVRLVADVIASELCVAFCNARDTSRLRPSFLYRVYLPRLLLVQVFFACGSIVLDDSCGLQEKQPA